jgi:hypothetical protein
MLQSIETLRLEGNIILQIQKISFVEFLKCHMTEMPIVARHRQIFFRARRASGMSVFLKSSSFGGVSGRFSPTMGISTI